MSYNGSGVYTLPGAQLANGEIVSATENNQFRNDVASALNVAWTRDGQAPATANIPMGSHKFTGLAAGTGAGDSVRYEQFASPPAIGNTAANTGAFTTLSASGNVTLGDASTDTLNVGNGDLVKNASGNVGIGTSSPTQKLHIYTASTGAYTRVEASTGTAYFGIDSTGVAITTPTNTAMYFSTNGSESMRIDSSGNVGIGTSSPSYPLTLGNNKRLGALNTGGSGVNFAIVDGSNNLVFGDDSVNSGAMTLQSRGNMLFQVNTAERMRIDSSGNLLVGTTSQYDVAKVSIPVTGGSTEAIAIKNTNTSNCTNIVFLNSSNAGIGSISSTTSATAYNTGSDYRLKENIKPMRSGLETVAKLNPSTWTWKADGSDGQGFIAHELQAVVPDCVTGEKDAVDAEGNPVYQGIDTSFLVATLCKAIQELEARVKQLEGK